VAVLKYRLYDLDRVISRVVSYTVITALLGGVYVGLIVLATRVLPILPVKGAVGVVSEAFQPTAVSMWLTPGPGTEPPAGPAAPGGARS